LVFAVIAGPPALSGPDARAGRRAARTALGRKPSVLKGAGGMSYACLPPALPAFQHPGTPAGHSSSADVVDVWVLAMATVVPGGGVGPWTRRRQDRRSPQVRAAVLAMAAAPALLAVLAVAGCVSTVTCSGPAPTPPRSLRPDRHRPGNGPPGRRRRGRAAGAGTARLRPSVRRHLRARHCSIGNGT